jgi:hypothetical protein
MTIASRRSIAIAALGMVLNFGAAFAIGRASAGGGESASSPTPFVEPKSLVTIRSFAPQGALPSLKQTPARSLPSSPGSSPSGPSTSAPGGGSSPGSGGGGGGSGGGQVIIG